MRALQNFHEYKKLTCPKRVFSIRALIILAAVKLAADRSFVVIIGVVIFFAAFMISFIRGTPSVTSTKELKKQDDMIKGQLD